MPRGERDPQAPSRFDGTLSPLPAKIHRDAQVRVVRRPGVVLEVGDVEVGQGVVDEAVHGAVRAVHVLVDQAGDEVRGEGDDKRLEEGVRPSPWQRGIGGRATENDNG